MLTLFKTRTLPWLSLSACLAAASFSGCGDDDDGENPPPTSNGGRSGSAATAGRGGSSSTAGRGGAGGAGGNSGASGNGSASTCDPSKKEVAVKADITEDTTWECGTYLLQKIVHVTGDSKLTIKPGVLVLGDTDTAGEITALVVTRGSTLEAVGTKSQPIIFTSGNPEGARNPGDWGGVVLLGKASINSGSCVDGSGDACDGGHFETNIEGLDPTDPKAIYGGTDDAYNCGHIEYARIEFAGYQLAPNIELNGLTLGGCGSDTKLSYIQVHRGSDDGMEFFGGSVGLDHVVLSAASDDSLDWDLGWRGKGQFVVIHQATNDGDKGIEADNLGTNETAAPRSKPELYNFTMIGNPGKVAINVKEGTEGILRNFIIQGFATAVDVNAATAKPEDSWPANLTIENSVFHDNKAVGDPDSDKDDDLGFNEDDAIRDDARKNVFDVNPELGSTSITDPDYKPGSNDIGDKATPPTGYANAKYAGAVDPAGDDWTAGWTSYPTN